MQFTSNHDENSWNGTVFERLGDAAETFAAFTVVVPGMPLVYSGQEAGMDKRLEFFEKDPIVWKEHPFKELYTKLFHLKIANPALHNGERGGRMNILDTNDTGSVFAFTREGEGNRIFALFNFSDSIADFSISSGNIEGEYTDFSMEESITVAKNSSFSLGPWGYKIFTR